MDNRDIPNLLRQAKSLVRPFMDQAQRDTWLTNAIQWRNENLYHDIDLSGATNPFTTRCIQRLWDYGMLDGDLALNHLLLTLKPHLGEDRRWQIDELIRQLRTAYRTSNAINSDNFREGTETMDSISQRQKLKRLQQLDELLDIVYDKRHEYEKELQIATGAARIEAKQRLKREVVPDLQSYETEQAQLLAELAPEDTIDEAGAEPLVGELIRASNQIQTHQDALPDHIQSQLQEILNQLQAPGKTAAAKLKVSLPIIPLLAAYELELDTESFLTQTWDKVKSLFRKAVDENPH